MKNIEKRPLFLTLHSILWFTSHPGNKKAGAVAPECASSQEYCGSMYKVSRFRPTPFASVRRALFAAMPLAAWCNSHSGSGILKPLKTAFCPPVTVCPVTVC